MADLSSIEKVKLEKFLDMGGGYVLNFSNRTFENFILENTNKSIYDAKYSNSGESKANRMRVFWAVESNYAVGELVNALLEYWRAEKIIQGGEIKPSEEALFNECTKIAEKLKRESVVENMDALQPNSDDKNFKLLEKSIKESIEKNEPEIAIDRLHTFAVKYIRELCDKYSIFYNKDVPLHCLFGGYVKYLRENNFFESEMTERILKSTISILEAFNDVRNNKSFAHDNSNVLNYEESVLIFNNVANLIKFIESIKSKKQNIKDKPKDAGELEEIRSEDIPF